MSGEPQKKERITVRPEAAKSASSTSSGGRDPASSTRPRMTKKEIADTSLSMGTTIAGRYRVERLLGSGGMGSVYEATQLAIGRRVAIKVLRPDVADDPFIEARFQREARAAASVHHPNVVVVHEFGRGDEGTLFLAMELLHGDSLLTRLRRLAKETGSGAMPPRESVRVAMEIASALEAAHAAGVVHRDLKPDNVTLLATGGLKVLDFGIARILQNDERPDTSEDRAQLTDAQQVLGTPRYISPEAVARLPVGPAADLYALGAILFEMLTGRPVFLDKEPVILMGQHLRDTPPKLREVVPELEAPIELEALVAQLLEKLPTERPASASVVRQRLAALDWSGRLVRDATKAAQLPAVTAADLVAEDDDDDALMPVGTPAPKPKAQPIAPPADLAARPPAPTLTPEAILFKAPAPAPGRADWVTPRSQKRPSIFGGVLLVLCVLAVAGVLVVHRMRLDEERAHLNDTTSAPPPTTSTEPIGPRAELAQITVQVNVENPTIRWDGDEQEGTSFSVEVDGRAHRLEVSARGYVTQGVEVLANGPHTVDLRLVRGRSRPR
ncbi:MAG: serine/threonine protein kinase [Deltaproteobacteria bacterium]|nr:serine/threonine protein kinase [Deltaproteobacteria bacterium]